MPIEFTNNISLDTDAPVFIPKGKIMVADVIDGFGQWSLDNYGLLTVEGSGEMPNLPLIRTKYLWRRVKDKIKFVRLSESITTIGKNAFYECRSLTSITIPNSVTTIGDFAFGYCKSLTSITISDSVTTIEDGAFSNCINLTSITIPNSVTTIGDGAFYCCNNLTSITIPNSVTNLGENAFETCYSLKYVKMPKRFDKLFFGFTYGIPKRIVEFT